MNDISNEKGMVAFCKYCNDNRYFFRLFRTGKGEGGIKLILYRCVACNSEVGVPSNKDK